MSQTSLRNILNELANKVEWAVQVPGSPQIDRSKELVAIETAHKAITDWIEREIIGEDEMPLSYSTPKEYNRKNASKIFRNGLRYEQRAKLTAPPLSGDKK